MFGERRDHGYRYRSRQAADRGSRENVPIYVAGEWQESGEPLEVRSPFDGSLVGTTYQASRQQLEEAIEGAVRAFEITRRMPTYERVALLKGHGCRTCRATR